MEFHGTGEELRQEGSFLEGLQEASGLDGAGTDEGGRPSLKGHLLG